MLVFLASVIGLMLITSIIAIYTIVTPHTKTSKKKWKYHSSEKEAIIAKANHQLSFNPKDVKALTSLGDLYFNEEDFEKAMRTYYLVIEQGDMDLKEKTRLNLNYGISAMRIEKWEEAYKGLSEAKDHILDHPEMTFSLGKLEFMRQNYKQSLRYIKRVTLTDPNYPEIQKYTGLILFHLNSFTDAKEFLEATLIEEPDNAETLYALGRCMYETNNMERALDLLKSLCTDPDWGAFACLYSGMIAAELGLYKEAIGYFEQGLSLQGLTDEILLEMKYLLAIQYAEYIDAEKGLQFLCEVNDLSPGYKDTVKRIRKYGEMTLHRNLEAYVHSPFRIFKKLCLKIIPVFYSSRNIGIKILDTIHKKREYLDVVAHIKSKGWEGVVLFRFVRTDGRIGELFIREFYTDMKECNATRGIFFSQGEYSSEAISFVEARFIELVGKNRMIRILNSIDF